MQTQEITLHDQSTNRKFPVMIYLPDNFDKKNKLKTVIFGNGFQEQERFKNGLDFYCKNYTYLAKFFTKKGYAFISLQFEIPGDSDSLENLDLSNQTQAEARKHLWVKDEKIIFFVLEELKKLNLNLDLNKFIISGHSNGADVAKYFTNNHPEMISYAIIFDGRRCTIKQRIKAKFLIFEALDTAPDIGIFPDEGTVDNPKRENIEWVVVKPKNAFHRSYTDKIDNKNEELYNPELKQKIYNTIEWFLNNF
jgi:predicted peptidase